VGLSYSDDRQTDRRTDGFTKASTALCIASYADALKKPRFATSNNYQKLTIITIMLVLVDYQ